jgi:hypothetical protein
MCSPLSACASLCLHCEREPAVTKVGLCSRCDAVAGIRRLYIRRLDWTPEREARILELTRRARLHLPLFGKRPCP